MGGNHWHRTEPRRRAGASAGFERTGIRMLPQQFDMLLTAVTCACWALVVPPDIRLFAVDWMLWLGGYGLCWLVCDWV